MARRVRRKNKRYGLANEVEGLIGGGVNLKLSPFHAILASLLLKRVRGTKDDLGGNSVRLSG